MLRPSHSAFILVLILLPLPGAAQAPGYQQLDTRQIMAEYHAEVLDGVNQVMDRWGRSWAADDADQVADLYWENATLIPPNLTPLRGRPAIHAYLLEAMTQQGNIEAFMLDFDASGGMAVVSGNYALDMDGQETRGSLTTVYSRRGKTWKIRAQVFTPSPQGG